MNEPRITSGSAKGRKLKVPEIVGIRIVQEKAKLALFSILGDRVTGAECLDLYAGSGNLGIEALSRGAKSCDFVDEAYQSTETIKENLSKCGFVNAEVFHMDAIKYAGNTDNKYDLVFMDPFYDNTSHRFLLKNLEEIIKSDGILVFFHGGVEIKDQIEGTTFEIFTERRFGASYFTVLKKA